MYVSIVGLTKPFHSVLLKGPSGNSPPCWDPEKFISCGPLHDAFWAAPQTFQWRADSTGIFPLCAITLIAPTTSVSVAPNCPDRHLVLLSSYFPSLERCYVQRGRFFEHNSAVHNLQPYFISVAPNILVVCALYWGNFTMYSRSVAFQLRLKCSTCSNSPIGASIPTSTYCYGNLTGLTGNCVVLWKGEHSPASISMAPKHPPYPSTSNTFQWCPDHFSGPLRLVVWW